MMAVLRLRLSSLPLLWALFFAASVISPIALTCDERIPATKVVYDRSFESAIAYDAIGGLAKGKKKNWTTEHRVFFAEIAEFVAVEGTAMRKVVQFEGMEVRAVRDLSHLSQGRLEAMQEFGWEGTTQNGDRIILHHLKQNPAGPVVEMPEIYHNTWNPVQHPFGNAPDAGLTAEQRAAFDAWREDYWSWRATQELNRRRLGL